MQQNPTACIQISHLEFSWGLASPILLQFDELKIQRGERVFILGPSGSGKSSLLGLMAGIQVPVKGNVQILDQTINMLTHARRDQFRADHIGFIFQNFNLIPYLSVLDNVTLPCLFSKLRKQRIQQQDSTPEAEARRLLEKLELSAQIASGQTVNSLSIGQQQRVAACRALMGFPELVIADEPTSSLDRKRRESFIELLFSQCQLHQSTLLFVSHDELLAPMFDRVIDLPALNTVS